MTQLAISHLILSLVLVASVPFAFSSNLLLPKIRVVTFSEGRYLGLSSSGRAPLNLTFQNESVYQLPAAVGDINFECAAPYPIMWNLADSGVDPETFPYVRIRTRRSFSDVFDPSTFNYTSQLMLVAPSNSHKLTGNYTCQSTANSMVSSSIYIYWEGTASLVHSGEILTVYVKNGRAVLPCEISNPHKDRPKLSKQDSNNRRIFGEVNLNRSISYSITGGYTLKDLPFPLGVYKCECGTEDVVTITVKQLNETAAALTKFKSNATFTFDLEKNQAVCCSSSKRAPKIFLFHCDHASTCLFREHAIQPYHFVLSRNTKKDNCAYKVMVYWHTALMRCIGDGIDQYKELIAPLGQYYAPWRKQQKTIIKNFFRWEEIEPQDMLSVSIKGNPREDSFYEVTKAKPSSAVYSQQTVNAECKISPYYFSEGSHWTIIWKNKTLSHPRTNDLPPSDPYYYYGSSESISVTIDISMEALMCFAPVWNSSLWVTKTYFLHVNETKTPIFLDVDKTAQEFMWYTNDTGKQLSCSASGTPAPNIIWQKGDQILGPQAHNYNISKDTTNDTAKSVLKIATVSYSTHGTFSCKASNYGGEVLQTFIITVQEQPSWRTTTVVIVAVIIICILLGVLGMFLKRMHHDKKAIQQLTAVHFKDPGTREHVVGTDVTNTTYDNGKVTNQLIS